MTACVQAFVPPSGGGPGLTTDALERVVMAFASPTMVCLVREVCDVNVGILVIPSSSSTLRDGAVTDG